MSKKIEVHTDILFYAFRYVLGRSTYAVEQVGRCIEKHASDFHPNDRRHIIAEIDEAIAKGHVGMPMDVETWKRVRLALTRVSGLEGGDVGAGPKDGSEADPVSTRPEGETPQ